MKKVVDFINSNKDRYVDELKDFLRIQSISTTELYNSEMLKCADFVAGKLKTAGMKKVQVISTKGHPLVYGEWLNAPGKPTVLIYGHYDVQPVDPLNLWKSPPFEPTITNGKIYARGATDDKGQMYVHIKSVEAYLKIIGKLPVNVKFLIEGEEEIGSSNLSHFIQGNSRGLSCDAVLISDTALFGPRIPTITLGLRGIAYLEVEMIGPKKDLHSGTYGGAVANPINVMAEIIAKMIDKNGHIAIPGFYDDVLKIPSRERNGIKTLRFSEKKYSAEIGVRKLQGEKGFSTLERTWIRPSLDCNGIVGGFTGDGAKTIIPSAVKAKLSMRLVPNQDPEKIAKLFTSYVKKITPASVKVKITDLHGGHPTIISMNDKAIVAASKAMERAFKKKTVYMREGGSIPIVSTFSEKLNAIPVLMGFGLNNENLHSPNEHFDLKHFQLGILSSAYFFDEFAR